jgi:hypothetical protein
MIQADAEGFYDGDELIVRARVSNTTAGSSRPA